MVGYITGAIAGVVLHILVVIIVNAIPDSWLEKSSERIRSKLCLKKNQKNMQLD